MENKPSFATQIAELNAAVESFCRYVEDLPPSFIVEKVWGTKEVLAHLHFWLNSYVVQIEAINKCETPQPPIGRFDDINVQIVSDSRGVSIHRLLSDYQTACDGLCTLASEHDPDGIYFCLKVGSKPKPLRWFITAETGHIRAHLRDLKYQSDGTYLQDVEKLDKMSAKFPKFIRALPRPLSSDAKDSLAQAVFWHEYHLTHIQSVLDGNTIDLPVRKQDELNADAVEIFREVSVDDLLARFEVADERLRQFGVTLDPQNIVIPMHWKNGFHWHTLDTIVKKVERDIAARFRDLMRNN